MLYTVNVKEINYGFVEVEADSTEEAIALAHDEVANGNGIWNDNECEVTEVIVND